MATKGEFTNACILVFALGCSDAGQAQVAGKLVNVAGTADTATVLDGGAVQADGSSPASDTKLADLADISADAKAPDASGQDISAAEGSGLEDLGQGDASLDGTSSDGANSDGASPDSSGDSAWNPKDKPAIVKGGLGSSCSSASDCLMGLFCAGAGGPKAYCSKTGCQTNLDCSVATDSPMCCLAYAAQTYCLQQFGGTTCGTQGKEPGESCIEGLQSDCDPANGGFCYHLGSKAVCVAGCKGKSCPAGTACQQFGANAAGCIPFTANKIDGSPCASNPIGGCGPGSLCIGAFNNDPLAYCAKLCSSDSQCAAGLACTKWNLSEGLCQAYGNLPVGSNCANDRFSCAKGLWCGGQDNASAICTHPCSAAIDCTDLSKKLGGSATCLINSEQSSGLCWPSGDKTNGASCGKDPLSCAPGAWCVGGFDAYNPDAFCQKTCGIGSDGKCPAGSTCVQMGSSYAGCQVQGQKGQGESCAGAPTSCKAGFWCLGPQGGEFCSQLCKNGAPAGSQDACPSGTWCSTWKGGQGSCLPAGSSGVGTACAKKPLSCSAGSFCQSWGQGPAPVCIAECSGTGACPSGTDCKDFGQAGKYCQPSGGKPQGQFCASTAECAVGSVCIAAGQPHAICSQQCKQDADCGALGGKAGGLWCGVGKWGGYCLPDGSGGEFASCYGKAWQCHKGLVCLGDPSSNPAAFCAKECSGFASVCGAGAKCQYLGGGQSWCYMTGTLAHGQACLEQPQSCDPTTLCIKGSPVPTCLQLCGIGKAPCPADSPCTWFNGSALQLCVPPGFDVGGAVRAPF